MQKILSTHPSSSYLAFGSTFVACAAAWCGVHCALTPLLAVAAPALGLAGEAEGVLYLVTVLLGGIMLALGPARDHRGVLLAFGGGAVFWAASLAGWLEPVPEPATSAAGSLTLAVALLQGARICRSGACSVCDEHTAD